MQAYALLCVKRWALTSNRDGAPKGALGMREQEAGAAATIFMTLIKGAAIMSYDANSLAVPQLMDSILGMGDSKHTREAVSTTWT